MSRSKTVEAPNGPRSMRAVPRPQLTLDDILMSRSKAFNQELLNARELELTYNGRGALFRACLEIGARGGGSILLPAYHCPSGITPAIHAGLRPIFYRIRRDMSIDADDLNAKVDGSTAAVLFIHFFGVATDLQEFQRLRERGIKIIEDWSHSFLEGPLARLAGGGSDYRIYSFWKLVPSFVGGGLWRQQGARWQEQAETLSPPMYERVVRMKRMIEEALNNSDLRRIKEIFKWFEAVRLARRSAPLGLPSSDRGIQSGESHYPFDLRLAQCRMPWLSRRILEASDLSNIVRQRRDNYNHYARLLVGSAQLTILHPVIAAETCPWVFPVLLRQRGEIDHKWRDAGVALHTFGIHLHSELFKTTDSNTIRDALYLSENMLCLAIHQNLSVDQIERSSGVINRHLTNSHTEKMT